MLANLMVGLPVMVICLVLQSTFITICLHYYARFNLHHGRRLLDFSLLSMVMLLMLLGNFVQMAVWALLFIMLGEFGSFATAFYFSAVNFVTLGYGDIVLTERWRLLGPLESTNGILMFGVSTAALTAAIMDLLKRNRARL